MKKLRFQIRTWNRAKKLEKCVRRMAEEVKKLGKEDECVIFVIDNYSDDETPKVLKKLQKEIPFLVTWRYPRWCKQGEFIDIPPEVMEKVEAQFVWFFGDDDLLLKDALPIVWRVLSSEEAEDIAFISVGQSLLTPHSFKIYHGTVWEFMNLLGFNQFAGWMASTIWNTELCDRPIFYMWASEETLKKTSDYETISLYNKTAFGHVLLLLHFCAYLPAVVIDYPVAEPMEVGDLETAERWEMENVGWRYFLFAKALKIMYDKGILEEKLKPGFFKYLEHNLWDRFLSEMIASRIGIYKRNPRPDEGWEIIRGIADIIDDPTIAKEIKVTVELVRALCDEYQWIKEQIEALEGKSLPMGEEKVKKELEKRKESIYQMLLSAGNEIVKPIFEKGWAGKGYKEKI